MKENTKKPPKSPKTGKNSPEKKPKDGEKVKKTRVKTPAMIANPGGRPSEFETVAPKIIEYIRKGNTYACASACARINYHTFNTWMKTGKHDFELGNLDTKFCKFYHDVQQAEKECEEEVLGYWKREMPGNWQACKEFLARRHYTDWGSKEKMDITSNGETVGKQFFLPMKDEDEDD